MYGGQINRARTYNGARTHTHQKEQEKDGKRRGKRKKGKRNGIKKKKKKRKKKEKERKRKRKRKEKENEGKGKQREKKRKRKSRRGRGGGELLGEGRGGPITDGESQPRQGPAAAGPRQGARERQRRGQPGERSVQVNHWTGYRQTARRRQQHQFYAPLRV